jgi:WhiB family transcriptional regulator, redox-sensing transcriptional regulator
MAPGGPYREAPCQGLKPQPAAEEGFMYARTDHRGQAHARNLGQGQRGGEAVRTLSLAAAGTWPQRDDGTALPCSAAPDLFFAERPEQIRQARALCLQCPARGPCLEGALQRAEPWGVWGGQLILSGAIIPAKRGRGRPRSASIPDVGSIPDAG